ncbi:MAG: hypothetical protein OJF48_001924 [Afipia sp.]|jgi:hypothetical protein|nr:MAG: hypothetical protein OJF48_001924 [Afipia sp.]
MPGDSVIGALRVVLGADTAALDTGLKRSQANVSDFADAVVKGMKIAAATVATAAGAMALAVQSGLNQADKMGKAAQKMGIPVEELSKLQHAANLSDVSLDQLGTGVGKLSKNLVEGIGNPSTAAARSLAALGISAKDSSGQLRPTSDVISDIAEKFSGMKDGAGKTALAMNLFGKSGAELIPMLNSGKTGLQEMKDEAAKLGLTITDKTAKAAEQFNDDLTRLKAAKEGVAMVITARLAPALADISSRFVNFVKDNDLVTKAADGFTRAIILVADNIKMLGNIVGIFVGARIVSTIAGIALSFVTLARAVATATVATTLLNAAKALSIARIAAFAGVIIYATGNMPAFVKALEDIGKAAAGMLPDSVSETITTGLKNLGLNTNALTAEIDKLGKTGTETEDKLKKLTNAPKVASEQDVAKLKAYQTQLASLGLQTRVAKGEFDALAPGFAQAAMQLGLFGDKGQKAVTTVAALTPQMAALNTAILANAAATAVQSLQTPYEKMQSSIAQYDMMLKNNMLTVDQHRLLSIKAAEDVGLSWQQQATSMAGSFGEMAQAFGESGLKMATAAKVLGVAQATIAMFVAGAEALKQPFPLNIAAMAAVLARGAAMVASIKATAIPKFAEGGLVSGPGTGTSDSIHARLSAGEFVMPANMTRQYLPQLNAMREGDFYSERASHDAGFGGQRGGPTIIEVRGFDQKKLYTGDGVRDLIEGIQSALDDGHIIRFKQS